MSGLAPFMGDVDVWCGTRTSELSPVEGDAMMSGLPPSDNMASN